MHKPWEVVLSYPTMQTKSVGLYCSRNEAEAVAQQFRKMLSRQQIHVYAVFNSPQS